MLIFSDSFDDRDSTNIVQGWTSLQGGGSVPSIVAAQGRRSTQALLLQRTFPGLGTEIRVTLNPGNNRAIIGFAYNPASAFSWTVGSDTNTSVFRLRLNGVTQCWAVLANDGKMRIYQGTNTLRYTSTTVLTQGVYVYLEFDIVVHASAGSIALYVNGVLDGTGTISGINTGANSSWNEYCMGLIDGGNGLVTYVDDLYICDGTGSRLNAPLGDTRVDATVPNAVGNSAQFTPSAGANWQCVDEPLANGDTDYVSSSTVGHVDTLNFPTAPLGSTGLHAVVVKLQARKTDAGAATLQGVTRIGSTDYVTTAQAVPGSTYNVYRLPFELNPATAAPWLAADYDAAEFGYKKNS